MDGTEITRLERVKRRGFGLWFELSAGLRILTSASFDKLQRFNQHRNMILEFIISFAIKAMVPKQLTTTSEAVDAAGVGVASGVEGPQIPEKLRILH